MTDGIIENVKVFQDTLKQVADKFPADNVEVVFYNGDLEKEERAGGNPIEVIHGGTVSTGYKYAKDMHVAILNFADAMKYGGWVEKGAQTQEENICRCTNLHPVLGRRECDEAYYAPNKFHVLQHNKIEIYTDRIIYAKGVTVFKNDATYENIEPRQLDVITCPAPSALIVSDEFAHEVYERRLAQILMSAADNGAACIVLGAWGCGAFGQNPKTVASSFARVLNKYSGYFKKVVFAIKPTPMWGEGDLYYVFRNILKEECVSEVVEG